LSGELADITAQSWGAAELIDAHGILWSTVIAMLLTAGADAKVKDSAGKTAFDYAQAIRNFFEQYPSYADGYRLLEKASE